MVSFLEAVFLGIVQGLTEWLPVSSSGHLVIVQQLLGITVPIFFDVALHFGTLFAVFVLFRKEIVKILKAGLTLNFNLPEGKTAWLLIVGSISSVPLALLLYSVVEFLFSSLVVVGIALLITGTFLHLTKFTKGEKKIGTIDSMLIGIVQGVSLIPGISRSGSTISAGLLKKIDKKLIFEFSFLLAIPAVIAANLFELTNVVINEIRIDVFETLIGTVIAAVIGYLSLKFLYNLLQKGKFYLFSYYCWIVGVLVLIYAIL